MFSQIRHFHRYITIGVVSSIGMLGACADTVGPAPSLRPQLSQSEAAPLTIETAKGLGPVIGTFTASGAFADHGTMENLSRIPSAFGAPTFLVGHLTVLFTGASGSFTIKAQIIETLTDDPEVLTNVGVWTVIDGTGDYALLRGQGTVTGTVDHHIDLIDRTFHGTVHFN